MEDEDGVGVFATPCVVITVAKVLEVGDRERWGSVEVGTGGDGEGQ